MLSIFLFFVGIAFALGHIASTRDFRLPKSLEIFLSYFFLFNMGMMGIFAAYAHVFMAEEIAREIGWKPGSPFQFEIGMANLSYGILGILSFFIRGRFWEAASIGWSALLLGCFVGHLIDYYTHGNNAPLNIGIAIWFYDLFLPLLLLSSLAYLRVLQGDESNPVVK